MCSAPRWPISSASILRVTTTSPHALWITSGQQLPLDVSDIPGLQQDSWLTFFLFYDLYPYYMLEQQSNRLRQITVVDSFMHSIGRHNLRYGVDYRRLVVSEALSVPLGGWLLLRRGIGSSQSDERDQYVYAVDQYEGGISQRQCSRRTNGRSTIG